MEKQNIRIKLKAYDNKILDASITDAKLAFGINPTKLGLGNVTNNAQLYSLNGLTTQIQNFGNH